MSSTVAVIQQKGGAGKTTLTGQLAATISHCGLKVGLVDMDPQQSLRYWRDLRVKTLGADAAMLIPDSDRALALAGAHYLREECDLVLIDTPPQDHGLMRMAIQQADLVLIPLQLTPFDLHATLSTVKTISPARRNMLFILNRVPPKARVADEMRAQFLAHDLPVAETTLGNRAAFAESMASGLGVVELPGAAKAAEEMAILTEEIFGLSVDEQMVA